MYDIVIRNGLVVDGTGEPGFRADVAIRDGKIVEVGSVEGEGRREIDAAGRVVAPGFIDPHTHFDVQLLWDGAAKPALEHGVTSIVPGNCSLSLAPLKAADRRAVVGMFQQIEEMPPEAFTEAFDWTWEDFAGYRDAIAKNLSINVAPLVGHSVIRVWVMGEAAQQRTANAAEISAMQDLLRECLAAGAVGLSTSFVDVDERARPVPSRFADSAELDALCAVLGEYGRMLQVVPEFYATDITIARIDQLSELSLRHNIPTTFSPVFDNRGSPNNVPRTLARVEEQFARGARVWPQMQTRPIDISFSLRRPSLFFASLPGWIRTLRLPMAERIAALKDEATVARLISDAGADGGLARMGHLTVRGGDAAPPELTGKTLAEIADQRGQGCARALIDLSLEHDLDLAFLSANMGHDATDRIGPMLAHPLVHIGASDGGAHISSFSTYGDTGYLFSEFVRKGRHLTLEAAVKKITSDTAEIWGLKNRGRLAPGWAADVVVFDAATLGRGDERPVFDMPGDGLRYVRDALGVEAVLVNGQVAYADGAYTNARSGVICT
ncbi:amidohydrolase family protein [Phenylobacterium sp. LH3H17]|uniref:N-acyl-D-amino-acid deacylase family protein n=1 Tax=Phenylobacterium sp. LH3H17 TaxID=2903901 RepID=UPI0020C9A7A8|nr:amidohydrolase family protein [Phenylobacterium sp. LH3H17]UTP40348.1 amidohydrolase family protein [Phenylobacterium sp. LH3H17]